MTIDYSALLYDPVYAELGVDAVFTAAGTAGEVAVTVIDDTRPKTITSGSAEVRSVGPGAFARIPELAENGITREDYQDAVLEFNGRAWVVRSYELRGSPNGEDVGEVRFLLKSIIIEEEEEESSLDLPLIAWEGGSAYWSQFAKADAAGWSDPSFFPIAVWFAKDSTAHATALFNLGINTYMLAERNSPFDITLVTNTGMFVLAGGNNPYQHPPNMDGWTDEEIGTNPNVVGWFLCDEPDLGLGGYIGTDDEDGWLAALEALAVDRRAQEDGRFCFANFANGIFNSYWSPNRFTEMVAVPDACALDKYAYTSGTSRYAVGTSAEWLAEGGTEANAQSSAFYGWAAKRMLQDYHPTPRTPFWIIVETKMPFLGASDGDRDIITYAQIEGAVWSAITNEARGICYFQHNGFYDQGTPPAIDPNTGIAPDQDVYSLIDCEIGLQTAVTTINSQITALAPVINTQSYEWDFGATGIDTMLKAKDGFAYVFASVGIAGTMGSKTFTLPAGLITNGTADVLNESRTVNISDGQFNDTFADEYSHHIYRVALA